MVALRLQLLRIPLGLSFAEEELQAEKDDIFLGFFNNNVLQACCVLTRKSTEVVKLRQMAVSTGLQGKGVGRELLQFAEKFANEKGYRKIIMAARKTAVGFYEKLGYAVVGGEFLEVTIPHYTMEKQL